MCVFFFPLSALATSPDSHAKDFKTVPLLINISSFSGMAVVGLHKPEKGKVGGRGGGGGVVSAPDTVTRVTRSQASTKCQYSVEIRVQP